MAQGKGGHVLRLGYKGLAKRALEKPYFIQVPFKLLKLDWYFDVSNMLPIRLLTHGWHSFQDCPSPTSYSKFFSSPLILALSRTLGCSIRSAFLLETSLLQIAWALVTPSDPPHMLFQKAPEHRCPLSSSNSPEQAMFPKGPGPSTLSQWSSVTCDSVSALVLSHLYICRLNVRNV